MHKAFLRNILYIHLLASALVLSTFTGCETAPRGTSSSSEEMHHRNWWNFYLRGTARLADENIQGAREDFERALGLRPGARFGYDEDQWRVRTYGMHYIEDYFPNREYGITLLLQREPAQAERYLERSLEVTPSGRAKFYLNRARREMLGASDPAAPRIELDPRTEERWTSMRVRPVKGVARGAARVEQVRIQGEPLFIELAEEEWTFSEPVTLQPGANRVRVEAVDLLGRTVVREIDWMADWQPPQLVIRRAVREQGGWLVEGICRDDHGLRSVMAGHARVDIAPPEQRPMGAAIRVNVSRNAPVMITAEDLAGNRFRRLLSAEDFDARMGSSARRYAQAGPPGVPDAGGIDAATGSTQGERPADRMRPMLDVSVSGALITVYRDEFFLDGKARDPGGLADLFVNGEPLMPAEDRGTVEPFYYARRIPLDEGTNTVNIVAVDLAGNESARTLYLIRLEPDYLDADYRLTIGVPPLRAADDATSLAEQVSWAIEEQLLETPVRFHLLERDEGWEYIMRELNISRSDLADPAAALQIRKLLPAELLLMGKVATEAKGLTVYVKVVETDDKGRILFEEDVYSDDPDHDLPLKLEGLVMKVEQRFPLVSGRVAGVSGAKVQLDVGASHGVRSGMGFIVLEPAGPFEELAEAKVRRIGKDWVALIAGRVRKTACEAKAASPGNADEIRPGDFVHAR